MIAERYITEWSASFPWTKNSFVEQDMVICRALVDIFSDPFLANALAFRGGTAIHKLHFSPQVRYSEDIDLVQVEPGPVKPITERLGKVLSWLPRMTSEMRRFGFRMKFRYESEIAPIEPMRLKVEVNTFEHFSVLGYASVPFEMKSSWYSGSCTLKTYSLNELMGTKLRALYQRKKGRDLFDLYLALPRVDVPTIVRVWREYMEFRDGEVPTAKQFAMNMDEKMALNDYLGDVAPLLRRGVTFNPHEAYAAFKDAVLPLISRDM